MPAFLHPFLSRDQKVKHFTCHFAVKKQPGRGKEAPIAPSTWSLFEVHTVNALELWQMLLSCSVSIQTVCCDEPMPMFSG